ncbi:hypothetical protein MJO29_015049 [Puccinia striiformis f. sp. tritici]|nr:hypothetical protein MJO29_015049 [Puccinia striiformis f. sp. tritici]
MQDSETFIEFSTRARTLQSLLNFDTANSFGDFKLAECITFSLPRELQAKISDFRLLRQKPFDYSDFEDSVAGYFEHLPKRFNGRLMHATGTPLERSTSPTSSSLWRLHSYLDSIGCCHFCKKTCGSEPGACRGQIDKKYTDIPASFVTPPKPTDYKPPKPWASPSSAGKATHPPAGRPPYWSSTVAGVEELPGHFNYDSAAVEAVQIVGKDFPEDDDNSSFYPELSAADISAYRAIDTVTASVQGVVIADEDLSLIEHVSHGLASIAVNDEELNNIIDEELSLTKEDEHRLAIDEGYVHSPLPSRLAFHPVQVSVNLRHRLSSGVPIRLLANQSTYALSFIRQHQMTQATTVVPLPLVESSSQSSYDSSPGLPLSSPSQRCFIILRFLISSSSPSSVENPDLSLSELGENPDLSLSELEIHTLVLELLQGSTLALSQCHSPTLSEGLNGVLTLVPRKKDLS